MSEPRLPRPVERTAFGLFESLSAARGRRIFHPAAVAYEATYAALTTEAAPSAVIFELGFERPALVRFSRGLSLPDPVPDFLGLAVRLPDAYGPGRHQDFLLVTSGNGPIVNHVPRPGSTVFSGSFSSLLPYRIGGRRLLVGASFVSPSASEAVEALAELVETAARAPVRFVVSLARPWGRWRPVAVVSLGERIPAEESARLRFNPWNAGGGVAPAGPINRLRDPAYRGSQRGRPTG